MLKTCIATATKPYGDEHFCYLNTLFAESPEKYGFTRISQDSIKPGDLIQYWDNSHPYHMGMVTKTNKEGQSKRLPFVIERS